MILNQPGERVYTRQHDLDDPTENLADFDVQQFHGLASY